MLQVDYVIFMDMPSDFDRDFDFDTDSDGKERVEIKSALGSPKARKGVP